MSRRYQHTSNFSTQTNKKGRRVYVYLFLCLAIAIMLFSRLYSAPLDYVGGRFRDTSAPFIYTLSRPVSAVRSVLSRAGEIIQLQNEMVRLKEENVKLHATQSKLMKLQGQNNALRALMNFTAAPDSSWITTKIISDISGAFSQAVVIDAGYVNKLKKGQAVVTGEGFVGRVAQVNNNTAVVLLLSDVNSSIPVMVEHTRDRAMLSGNNSEIAELRHLSPQVQIRAGAKLVTSGANGTLPEGIPVGHVTSVEGDLIKVQLAVHTGKMEVLRVITQSQPIEVESIARKADKTLLPADLMN